MFNVGDYLKKFVSYKKKNDEIIFVFKEISKKNKINLENISVVYKDKTIIVNGPNILKNQLYIKKQTILENLKEKSIEIKDIL